MKINRKTYCKTNINIYLYKNFKKIEIMETIITLAIYFILLVVLLNSKLKTSWIIWTSFMVGWSVSFIAQNIIKLSNF